MGKKKESIDVENVLEENPQAKPQEKKDFHWHTTFGNVAISERTFIINGKLVRPFSNNANVDCRSYSVLLQRRITDFGSDCSFGKAVKKMNEHYGLILPESSIRAITQAHGENLIAISMNPEQAEPQKSVEQIIVQTDGCMLPRVEFDPEKNEGDLRKARLLNWKEVRLSLAYEPGMVEPVFEATSGNPEKVGTQLMTCAQNIGYGEQTNVHGVGDGATWIASQVDQVFGANGSYLIDFYHLCEYLSDASKVYDKPATWYKEKKEMIKTGKIAIVLKDLLPYIEPPSVKDTDAPVRRCHRYIANRRGQFHYAEAIENNLPIGSGKIESANSYVIQHRMKIPGAWWKLENMDKMLALLTCRKNGKWGNYWEGISTNSAARVA